MARVRPHDQTGFDRAFRAITDRQAGYAVVQAYLPEANEGEKRLVWLDGRVLGGYLRRRAPGEFRHNLKRGGLAEPVTVSDEDLQVVEALNPPLLAAGIRLAGLDLIGGHLIEVNALNPGGTFHTDRLNGSHLADTVIAALERNAPIPKRSSQWALPVP